MSEIQTGLSSQGFSAIGQLPDEAQAYTGRLRLPDTGLDLYLGLNLAVDLAVDLGAALTWLAVDPCFCKHGRLFVFQHGKHVDGGVQ